MPASKKPTTRTVATPARRKPVLSPTKFRIYLECAVKYRYLYLDKIGRYYTKARSYYSFGSTLHHVLQEFHQTGAVQTAQELTDQVGQKWISAGYESAAQEAEHRETGAQIVNAYHAAQMERALTQVETLATEKTISCDMGQFRLTGRIDRLDRLADGTLEVVDYKSGRLEVTSEEVAADLAMNCYQLIMKKLEPDSRVIASIYCLRSGAVASAELTGQNLLDFAKDIRALGTEILSRDLSAARPVQMDICADCEFLSLCNRYWAEQAAEEQIDPEGPDTGI